MDQNRDNLTDKEKIDRAVDRAAWREEVRFLKKQQWAVATAGVVLLSGLLAAIRDYHLTALDKFILVGIRLEISCADSPITDFLFSHVYRPDKHGTDTIHHNAEHPSELILPVLDD